MSDIGPINLTPPSSPGLGEPSRPSQRRLDGLASDRGVRPDSAEFSERALALSRLRDAQPVRNDLVERVRNEISAGTYETQDKIEAAAAVLAHTLNDIDVVG